MPRHAAVFALLALPWFSASAHAPFRVGMDTRSPPWAFVPGLDYASEDANKDPRVSEAQLKRATGIDVDVARALARRLGRPLRIVPVAWFDLERALVSGRIDAIQSQVVERTLRSVGAAALRVYDTQETLFEDLKGGKIGAVLYDSPYVRWRVSRDQAFRTVGDPLNRLGYHLGVRREDAELYAAIQAALGEFQGSGEREEVRRKWEAAP